MTNSRTRLLCLITYYTNRCSPKRLFLVRYYSHRPIGQSILFDAEPLLQPADELVDLVGRVQVLGDAGAFRAALGPGGEPGALLLDAEVPEPFVGEEPRREWHERDVDEAERLPAEEAALAEGALQRAEDLDHLRARLRVAVPALPRISNHTDLDALRLHPDVECLFVGPGEAFPACDLVVLPGSKSTRADLAWLRAQGWDTAILRHVRYGGRVIGICGGMQMLGRVVHDPDGIEGPRGSSEGLGLLDFETTLAPAKQLRNVRGYLAASGAAVTGYEIHCGVSLGAGMSRPAVQLEDGRGDGARSDDGRVAGTYLHGLFDRPEALAALLGEAGLTGAAPLDIHALRDATLDRLADTVDAHMDTATLASLFGLPSC